MTATRMSLDDLMETREWRLLPPPIKHILVRYFEDDFRSLPNAIAVFHSELSGEAREAMADRLMQDTSVTEVLNMYLGRTN